MNFDPLADISSVQRIVWLAYCKMPPDAVEHPGISGILHLTHFILGQTEYLTDIQNEMVVMCIGTLKCKRACQLSLKREFSRVALEDVGETEY